MKQTHMTVNPPLRWFWPWFLIGNALIVLILGVMGKLLWIPSYLKGAMIGAAYLWLLERDAQHFNHLKKLHWRLLFSVLRIVAMGLLIVFAGQFIPNNTLLVIVGFLSYKLVYGQHVLRVCRIGSKKGSETRVS